jgi:cardiolipin synthase A/B
LGQTAKHSKKLDRRKHLHEVAKHDDIIKSELDHHRSLRIFALVGILLFIAWIGVAIFEPTPAYRLEQPVTDAIDSPAFIRQLEGVTAARLLDNTHIDPIYNGENYYEAEIAAMKSARQSINLEAYIFKKGEIARRAIHAMTERARAGVKVNVVIDAMGAPATTKSYFKPLIDAGGHVAWYHALRWYNWYSFNNRTHRELLVIDGTTAFVGGAGYADYWHHDVKDEKRWRDNMFRVQGEAAGTLRSIFVENWLEASDTILSGPRYFPEVPKVDGGRAMVVGSSPGMGGSTNARILFQMLMSGAQKSIDIASPYFLPDKGVRDELVHAAKVRGVRVRILCPGDKTDHKVVRASSRRNYGELLQAGAKVYEYEPAMIHEKLLIVDGKWTVIGSTNMDTRSFGLNDEVNVAALDPDLARQVTIQYEKDLGQSREITLKDWQHRSLWERAEVWMGELWVRQQ